MAGILASMFAGGAEGGFKAMGENADENIKSKREQEKADALLERQKSLQRLQNKFSTGERVAGQEHDTTQADKQRAFLKEQSGIENTQKVTAAGKLASQNIVLTEAGINSREGIAAEGNASREKIAANALEQAKILAGVKTEKERVKAEKALRNSAVKLVSDMDAMAELGTQIPGLDDMAFEDKVQTVMDLFKGGAATKSSGSKLQTYLSKIGNNTVPEVKPFKRTFPASEGNGILSPANNTTAKQTTIENDQITKEIVSKYMGDTGVKDPGKAAQALAAAAKAAGKSITDFTNEYRNIKYPPPTYNFGY